MGDNNKKQRFILTLHGEEYSSVDCITDYDGKTYCVFEKRNGLGKERVKFSKEELTINYEDHTCKPKFDKN